MPKSTSKLTKKTPKTRKQSPSIPQYPKGLQEAFLQGLMQSVLDGTFQLTTLLPDAKLNLRCSGRDQEGCKGDCPHRIKHSEVVAVVGTVDKPEVLSFCGKCFCYQVDKEVTCTNK